MEQIHCAQHYVSSEQQYIKQLSDNRLRCNEYTAVRLPPPQGDVHPLAVDMLQVLEPQLNRSRGLPENGQLPL